MTTRPSVLETPRLLLCELQMEDAPFILKLLNEAAFIRYIGDKGVRTLADAENYLSSGPLDSYRRHGFGLYLTCRRRDGDSLGICGLVRREVLPDADLGFAFLESHTGQGYATESAGAVLDQAERVLKLPRVVAITHPDNHASIAVLAKVGLRFERNVFMQDGREVKLFAP